MMVLQEKLEKLRDLKAEFSPILNEIRRLEKEVKTELLETGEIVEVPGVLIRFKSGYIRSTWDNKMLEGYALSRPEILRFRKETHVRPSVSLSFK